MLWAPKVSFPGNLHCNTTESDVSPYAWERKDLLFAPFFAFQSTNYSYSFILAKFFLGFPFVGFDVGTINCILFSQQKGKIGPSTDKLWKR